MRYTQIKYIYSDLFVDCITTVAVVVVVVTVPNESVVRAANTFIFFVFTFIIFINYIFQTYRGLKKKYIYTISPIVGKVLRGYRLPPPMSPGINRYPPSVDTSKL